MEMASSHCSQLLLTIAILVSSVTSQIYLPCEVILVPGCSCWNPDHPIIKCQHLNLGMFPQISSNISGIHTLDLSHNHLTFIPERALLRVNTSNILNFIFAARYRKLDMSHNGIVSLSRNAFWYSGPRLHVLDMSHNNLTEVPYAFQKSSDPWRLTTLDLSFNHIATIETEAFRNLRSLKKLFLHNNPIGSIQLNPWKNLQYLSVLKIGLRSVKRRKMYATSIPTEDLQSLQSISVSGAEPQFLAVVQMWLMRFPNLKHLELASMRLNDTHITPNSLSNFSAKLESLSLPNNHLRKIPGLMLSSLSALKALDLSGNKIRKFVQKSSQLVPLKIIELNLSRNNIKKVNTGAITRLEKAKMIDLSQNQISAINFTPARLDSLNIDVTFRLGGNPWICDCTNVGIRTLIEREVQRSNGHLEKKEINQSIQCNSGGNFANQLMVDVAMSQFECKRRRNKKKRGKEAKKKGIGFTNINKKTNSQKGTHSSLAKPITSIFYNRNIHAYQNSGTNVDIPKEILELLGSTSSKSTK